MCCERTPDESPVFLALAADPLAPDAVLYRPGGAAADAVRDLPLHHAEPDPGRRGRSLVARPCRATERDRLVCRPRPGYTGCSTDERLRRRRYLHPGAQSTRP